MWIFRSMFVIKNKVRKKIKKHLENIERMYYNKRTSVRIASVEYF